MRDCIILVCDLCPGILPEVVGSTDLGLGRALIGIKSSIMNEVLLSAQMNNP